MILPPLVFPGKSFKVSSYVTLPKANIGLSWKNEFGQKFQDIVPVAVADAATYVVITVSLLLLLILS